MKKIFSLALLFAAISAQAENITLSIADYNGVQIAQAGNAAGQPEGLYILSKNNIVSSSTCTRKNFVVITDPKLIDRALSTVYFAAATQKNLTLYVNSSTQCVYDAALVTMIGIAP